MSTCENKLPNPKAKEFVEQYVLSTGFEDFKLTFAPGSAKGDNFVGSMFKINIKGLKDGKEEELNVILKAAPVNREERETIPIRDIFLRETYIYKVVIPAFEKLQKSISIDADDMVKFAPCLMTNVEDFNEFIVLEDLTQFGYKMHGKRILPLDYDHIALAISSLAKFHALSYVLKEKNPTDFERFSQNVPEITLREDSKHEGFKNYLRKTAAKCCVDFKDKKEFEIFQRFADNIFESLVTAVKPCHYSVICHGDYWKNNMLFRYNNNIPDSVIAFDFQIVRFCSPATDIFHLIFIGTTQEFRKKYYSKVISLYYETFKNYLSKFKINSENVFPKCEYLNELKRVGPYALGIAVCALPFMACSDDNLPNAAEGMKLEMVPGINGNVCQERLYEVLQDCIEYGYVV